MTCVCYLLFSNLCLELVQKNCADSFLQFFFNLLFSDLRLELVQKNCADRFIFYLLFSDLYLEMVQKNCTDSFSPCYLVTCVWNWYKRTVLKAFCLFFFLLFIFMTCVWNRYRRTLQTTFYLLCINLCQELVQRNVQTVFILIVIQ